MDGLGLDHNGWALSASLVWRRWFSFDIVALQDFLVEEAQGLSHNLEKHVLEQDERGD